MASVGMLPQHMMGLCLYMVPHWLWWVDKCWACCCASRRIDVQPEHRCASRPYVYPWSWWSVWSFGQSSVCDIISHSQHPQYCSQSV